MRLFLTFPPTEEVSLRRRRPGGVRLPSCFKDPCRSPARWMVRGLRRVRGLERVRSSGGSAASFLAVRQSSVSLKHFRADWMLAPLLLMFSRGVVAMKDVRQDCGLLSPIEGFLWKVSARLIGSLFVTDE